MAEPRECIRCHRVRKIASRELCTSCYSYERQLGDLSKYPPSNAKKKKRYDNCVDCGEYAHIRGRDRCNKCIQRLYMSSPENKKRHAEQEKQRRVDNLEKVREQDRRRAKTDKRRNWRKKYQKGYYRDNPEIFIKAKKKWEDKHPGLWARYTQIRRNRESELAYTLTDSEWEEIKKSYHYLCIYCDGQFENLVREHWIPLTRGGGFTKENIVPACQPCNSRKKDMTGDEFMELLDLQEWEWMKLEFDKVCA